MLAYVPMVSCLRNTTHPLAHFLTGILYLRSYLRLQLLYVRQREYVLLGAFWTMAVIQRSAGRHSGPNRPQTGPKPAPNRPKPA